MSDGDAHLIPRGVNHAYEAGKHQVAFDFQTFSHFHIFAKSERQYTQRSARHFVGSFKQLLTISRSQWDGLSVSLYLDAFVENDFRGALEANQ